MKKGLEKRLKNKAVFITGASRGVGRVIAESLSIYGMKIGLLARSEQQLKKVQKLVEASGSEAIVLCADLKNIKEIEEAVNKFKQRFGTADFLINNAGIGIRSFWEDISLDEELDIIKVNYIAAVSLIRLFLPDMLRNNSGHIININSLAGMYAAPYQGAYCASKAALLAYSTSLAYELDKTRVVISSIFSGPIDTDFLNEPNFEFFKNRREKVTPQKIASRVLSIINHPKEMSYVGSLWRLFAVKVANFNPRFFRRIVESKNTPPKKRHREIA